MAKYFGTNGVRGRYDELTPELILNLVTAIGCYFKKTKQTKSHKTNGKPLILVARDCRLSGPLIRNLVCAAVNSVGVDVTDLGVVSAPTAELMIEKLNADGCIIITASHNPPEWNALKLVDSNGVAISKERGEQIEAYMNPQIKTDHSQYSTSSILVDWFSLGYTKKYNLSTLDHVNTILNYLGKNALQKISESKSQNNNTSVSSKSKKQNKKLKIAFDCGNGTASFVAPLLFEKLGVDFVSINSTPDGRFPGRNSEPSEVNISDLIKCVKDNQLDAGIAWDGDGDRVVFVDEQGNYVIGDQVFALSLLWKIHIHNHNNDSVVSKTNKKTDVVTTVATSKAIEEIATSSGYKTKYTAIGAPYLSEEVAKNQCVLLAGEEVGGVIWPEFSLAKDGFLTAAKMIEAISIKPLSEWLKLVPKYYNVKRKIDATPEQKKQVVQKILNYVKSKNIKHTTVDGVRVDYQNSWVIVRSSGTENYVRIFAEAKTEEEAKKLVDEFEKIARS